jgi:hypothetical protein
MKKYKEEIDLQDELVEDIEEFDEDIEVDEAKQDENLDNFGEKKAKPFKKEEADEDDEESDEEEAEDDEEEEAEEEEEKVEKKEAKKEENFKSDLDALVESEATLSEGFRAKASVIFEAALNSKISETVERLEEDYAERMDEEVTTIQTNLIEKVDGYLNYVVETWMEDNALEVEKGIRTEIAESFMDSLQAVFKEHYVEVPEGKVDLVDELSAKVDTLEEDYNTEIARGIELKEENAKLVKQQIIRESSIGLSESEIEKLKSLVEDIDFESAETFATKVNTLKESYFKTTVVTTDEEELNEFAPVAKSLSDSMSQYVAALSIK